MGYRTQEHNQNAGEARVVAFGFGFAGYPADELGRIMNQSESRTKVHSLLLTSPNPMTPKEISEATGLDMDTVKRRLNHMAQAKEIRNTSNNRLQGKYQMTPLGKSKTKPVGANKEKFEAFMNAATRAHTTNAISEATGIAVDIVRHFCMRYRESGKLLNLEPVVKRPGLYIMAYKVENAEPKPKTAHRGSIWEIPAYIHKEPKPARPGADDHEKIPSRRADGYKPHRPMMLMGSSVRGESGR